MRPIKLAAVKYRVIDWMNHVFGKHISNHKISSRSTSVFQFLLCTSYENKLTYVTALYYSIHFCDKSPGEAEPTGKDNLPLPNFPCVTTQPQKSSSNTILHFQHTKYHPVPLAQSSKIEAPDATGGGFPESNLSCHIPRYQGDHWTWDQKLVIDSRSYHITRCHDIMISCYGDKCGVVIAGHNNNKFGAKFGVSSSSDWNIFDWQTYWWIANAN